MNKLHNLKNCLKNYPTILKSLKNYIDWKNNSSIYKLWFVLFLALIMFTPYIEGIPQKFLFINENITEPKSFKVIYILATIIALYIFLNYIKRAYIISNFLKFLIYLSSFFYLYLRLFSQKINFIPISRDNLITFSDFFLFILLLMIVLELVCFKKFYNNENTKIDKMTYYLNDDVYSFNEEGYSNYEYKNYVEEVVKSINNMNSDRAFTISINSKWGTGKTTFMKAIENRLANEKEFIVINFNVWKYDSKESLLKDYFSELNNRFKEYSGNSNNTINDYFSNLFLYAGLNFKNLIDSVFTDFFTGKKNPHDKTERLIKRINKKVVVLIDDLDRLKSEEINQTLKLIRNNSEFKNFFIISTIDEDYLINEGGLKNNFLEKVFNLQIDLSLIPSYNLFNYFLEQLNSVDFIYKNKVLEVLKAIFNNNMSISDTLWRFELIDNSRVNLNSEYKPQKNIYFNQIITTRRQAKRFINYLVFSFINIKNDEDVDLKQYILFQTIIFRFPIFKFFFNENKINKILKIKNGVIIYDKDVLKKFLEVENKDYKLFDNYEIEIIETLLFKIFSETSESIVNVSEKLNDICLINYFPIYYNQNIYSQTINLSEIKNEIKNKNIEKLFVSYIEKPNFDSNIFKKVCLINGNYSELNQIINFLDFTSKYYEDNISSYELLIFVNGFDKSFYKKIFDYVFDEKRLLKYSIFLNLIIYIKDIHYNKEDDNMIDIKEIINKNFEYLSINKINNLINNLIEHININLNIEEHSNVLFKLCEYSYDKLLSDYYSDCRKYSSKFLEEYKMILSTNSLLLEILYLGSNLTSDIHYSTFEIFLNDEDKKDYEEDLKKMHSQSIFNSEDFGAIRKKYLTKGKSELLEFINSLDKFDKKTDVVDKINQFYTF